MSRAIPFVIILLLLVWAVLATMALNKATEETIQRTLDDLERIQTVATELRDRDMLIRTFYDSLAAQDHLLDSLRSLRMNPEVFHREAAQKTDGASVDSLVNTLEQGVQ